MGVKPCPLISATFSGRPFQQQRASFRSDAGKCCSRGSTITMDDLRRGERAREMDNTCGGEHLTHGLQKSVDMASARKMGQIYHRYEKVGRSGPEIRKISGRSNQQSPWYVKSSTRTTILTHALQPQSARFFKNLVGARFFYVKKIQLFSLGFRFFATLATLPFFQIN